MNYQSTYRRSEFAIPGLLVIVAIFIAGAILIVKYGNRNNFETEVFSLTGFVVVAFGLLFATAFRVHRWTILQDGVAISERPKLRFFGLSRNTTVPFTDIAALRNIESGFDRLIEIATRDGRRFRLGQAYVGTASEMGRPDPNANLHDFATAIRAAAERAGTKLPSTSEGLSFWNSAPGLTLLILMFAISLAISGTVGWALLGGMTTSPRPRGGEAIAILLLLPVGAGWLLLKSYRRRAAVLAAMARRNI